MQGRGAKQQSRLARQINLLVKKFGGRQARPDRSPLLIRSALPSRAGAGRFCLSAVCQ